MTAGRSVLYELGQDAKDRPGVNETDGSGEATGTAYSTE